MRGHFHFWRRTIATFLSVLLAGTLPPFTDAEVEAYLAAEKVHSVPELLALRERAQ